ncbi:MAG: hypothetical protein U9N82_01800 [Thermodesulfobacteriota bacterium]|nr:hypothetical protein [Thermodesulfobacteriota bacterium]
MKDEIFKNFLQKFFQIKSTKQKWHQAVLKPGPKVIEQISLGRRSGRHSRENRNPDASGNLDSKASPE